jgi:hypothetical protein
MKMKPNAQRTICADGTSLSVQASKYHYCTPRDDYGPYSAVGAGYIENAKREAVTPPESWREYGDGEFPSSVYGYVPTQLVEEFIAAHGGRADSQNAEISGRGEKENKT